MTNVLDAHCHSFELAFQTIMKVNDVIPSQQGEYSSIKSKIKDRCQEGNRNFSISLSFFLCKAFSTFLGFLEMNVSMERMINIIVIRMINSLVNGFQDLLAFDRNTMTSGCPNRLSRR